MKGRCPRPLDDGDADIKMVSQEGLEPSTPCLKGRYSTTELLAHELNEKEPISIDAFCQLFFEFFLAFLNLLANANKS